MTTLSEAFLQTYATKQAPWGFGGLGEVVYLRTYSRKTDTGQEGWVDTIRRVIEGAVEIGVELTEKEAQQLFDHMFNLRCTVSGRALWQLGTPLVKKFNAASMNNCYFTNIEKIKDFELIFDYLMLGGGVGFSVERSKIHELPKIKSGVTITHERTNDADIIVPDSRQGWKRLLHAVLKSFFDTGNSFTYSTLLVREYGAALKTFGGTASGPGALIDGIDDICKVMQAREGKKLRSVDVLDICNIRSHRRLRFVTPFSANRNRRPRRRAVPQGKELVHRSGPSMARQQQQLDLRRLLRRNHDRTLEGLRRFR